MISGSRPPGSLFLICVAGNGLRLTRCRVPFSSISEPGSAVEAAACVSRRYPCLPTNALNKFAILEQQFS